jgi:hypothetical protein
MLSALHPTHIHVALDHCADISITPRKDLLENFHLLRVPLGVNTITNTGRNNRRITHGGTLHLAGGKLKINNFKYLPEAPYTILCGADLVNAGLTAVYTTTGCHIVPTDNLTGLKYPVTDLLAYIKKISYITFRRFGKLFILNLEPKSIEDPKETIKASYITDAEVKRKQEGSEKKGRLSEGISNPSTMSNKPNDKIITGNDIKQAQDKLKSNSLPNNAASDTPGPIGQNKSVHASTRSSSRRRRDSPAAPVNSYQHETTSDSDSESTNSKISLSNQLNRIADYSKYASDNETVNGEDVDPHDDVSLEKWLSQQ